MEYSDHAITRMAQRGFSDEDVRYIMKHGQRIHRTGIVFYFLGRKDIPEEDLKEKKYRRLEGSTILINTVDDNEQVIITVYRDRGALRNIRRKHKSDAHKISL